jgi:protein gp37
MNKTKIEWCDVSWNVITGCLNGCSFCYARRIALRFTGHFKPTFHENRLFEPLHEIRGLRIFSDSMGDFWSPGVKQEWRSKIWNVMGAASQHTFFVLTKRPDRITNADLKQIPCNVYVGVSITKFDDRLRIVDLINKLHPHIHNFVSVEPCLDDNISDYVFLVDWVIVGGLTGIKNPFRPKDKTIEDLVSECERLRIPLFIKNNLGFYKKVQEFPVIL